MKNKYANRFIEGEEDNNVLEESSDLTDKRQKQWLFVKSMKNIDGSHQSRIACSCTDMDMDRPICPRDLTAIEREMLIE
ncbi:hypothetical protein J6590_005296 [Homalodisca vitripennis]|nr:hypothetical protein J6590_005296 [Homalodisca vitripennis]